MTPIAVIGMACRLPHGINSPERLWEALLAGEDLVGEIPAERWDADSYYDPEPGVPDRSVSRWGGFLDDVAGFDPRFFGIGAPEAAALDPQHRLLLEVSWEAVEHAGVAPQSLTGAQGGVFVGLSQSDYALLAADAGALGQKYGFTGSAASLASGRIAHTLGLRGPALTVDTAGSSSLLAVHMACRSLHEGESDLALAGGCMVMLEPRSFTSLSGQRLLSPTGRCRTFDVGADGYVRSEGCAMVLLKRLPDALQDGDRILAVLRGTSANQDANQDAADAQVSLYRAALAAAGVDADTVGMIEADGAGSPRGDSAEFASLAQVYGTDGNECVLGSVKSNAGHADSAAGALALIKAILSLRHGAVPPMLHFTRLPDDLAGIETGLVVAEQTTPVPATDTNPRRAGVSSYGLSGTNVHAILEQAPEPKDSAAQATSGPLLFALSSTSADGLRETSHRLADWLQNHADSVALPDLAYTLARRRGYRPVRTALVADDVPELIRALCTIADDDNPYCDAVGQDDRGPVWMFSGEGSLDGSWAAMGADLLANEPVFAATVAQAEPLIAAESGFSVTEAISSPHAVTGIDRVEPTLFTMQVALAATMEQSYGVRPAAVLGHSAGEVAAAVVAGALSLEDGLRVICRRSALLSRTAGAGAMASAELPADQVLSELMTRDDDDVVIAMVTGPQSTVIAGPAEAVRELLAAWEQRGVVAREMAVEVAANSPHVDPILDELSEALADLNPTPPQIPFYSTTSFDPRERPVCNAGYWVDNVRHTVRFAAAAQAAVEDGHRVFAELAPQPQLIDAVEQTAAAAGIQVAGLAGMPAVGPRGLLAELHSAGAAVDFSVLYPVGCLVDAPLPAWTHGPPRSPLIEGQESSKQSGFTVSAHPLLGVHVRLPEEPERHVWQAHLGPAAQPWLADYQICGATAVPGAVYCEMALAAARTVLGEGSAVRDVQFEPMLQLNDEISSSAVASVDFPGAATFIFQTEQQGERKQRAGAELHAVTGDDQPPALDIAALLAAHPRRVEAAEVRQRVDDGGVHLGPAFTGLTAVHLADETTKTILGEVNSPGSIRSQQAAYAVHPALLDACFQALGAHPALDGTGNGGTLLPIGVRWLRAYGPTRNARYCHARVTVANDSGGADVIAEADLDICDGHGTVLLALRGLQLGTTLSKKESRDRVLNERLLTIEWQRRELPEDGYVHAGAWLLISTSDAAHLLATGLTDALKLHRAECTTMFWPQHGDHAPAAEVLRGQLGEGRFAGVVVVTAPKNGNPDDECALRGREYAAHVVRIARELSEITGESPRLYVVTRSAQAVLDGDRINLEQGGLRGLLRVIGTEHPHLWATHIDIDDRTGAEQVARQLLVGSDEDETAWRNDEWYAARLSPTALRPDEGRQTLVDHSANHGRDGMRLRLRTPGDMETMEFVAFDRVAPGPGQIEVAVTASSLNFLDVLAAFGRYPTFEGHGPQPGSDFVGVVTAVGPHVSEHKVGDRVGGMSPNGCWATFVTCDARLAAALPEGLTDAQAAAVTTAHATAWHGLTDLARIKAGDKVLIHSATGGVGQAAVGIARAAGAEVFATAGSPERRELLRAMGIKHVYDSRSLEFAEQIRRDTHGYGVDIVLNSVAGAAQQAGLQLLASGGRFVEIGKRDVYDDSRIGLFAFRRNLTFSFVDLALMSLYQPSQIRELLDTVYRSVADGALPMPQSTHYPLAEAATAIRVMCAAEHVGKLVLDIPREGQTTALVPPEQAHVFRGDGAYIITGGLGSIGLVLAESLASAGCGRIVLCSRAAPSASAQETIELIRAIGSDVVVEHGDIALAETADRLVAAATATGLPLRGVLHAAGVIETAGLANITDELLTHEWTPKVYGAWHLHQATSGQPLDWFCSFSSSAALLGSPGLGAYAAANSWLDAFTHWRRAQGLTATSIAWQADADGNGTAITLEEGAHALEALLRHDRAYTGYTTVIGTPWLTALAQHSPYAERFQHSGQNRVNSSKFRTELMELPPEERSVRLRELVAEQVGLILRRNVDADRPLHEYGLDSLGHTELRTRIEAETGVSISPGDIITVGGLAQHLGDALASQEA